MNAIALVILAWGTLWLFMFPVVALIIMPNEGFYIGMASMGLFLMPMVGGGRCR